MAQKPILYFSLFSPPARACIITAKFIRLDLDLKAVEFSKKELLSEVFLKLNPQHQIPLLIDTDGEVYLESHAIICFMVSKYAKTDKLYSRDLKRRAHIDHRLHFESGVLFQVIKDIVARNVCGGEAEFNVRTLELCHNAYASLEQFLEQGSFFVGNEMSVADISIHTTLITLDLLVPVDEEQYPKIIAWLERMKKLQPDNDGADLKGAQALQLHILNCMAENKSKGTK